MDENVDLISTFNKSSQYFFLSNLLAFLGWFLLVVFPRWGYTFWFTRFSCLANAAIYFSSLSQGLKEKESGKSEGIFSLSIKSVLIFWILEKKQSFLKSMSSLEGVIKIFRESNHSVLLASWVHYLCFDLLIGEMIVRESLSLRIPWLMTTICLGLTYIFGPIGFAAFEALKFIFPK
ncbi:hypothetical protein DSO57_1022956 [Entomophthora muscae]|uniref:Uncharacterized protein n=1 Tax=Entomophthora muscae TaxID=34485 RepID=A0ACC2RU06_9FUNG|nr:hypothetical protein DSO57_1022956 [Entomophthora muscae]